MKFTSIKKENTRYVQFYINKEELEDEDVKKTIEKYKSEKCNVAVFITGNVDCVEVLEKIVKYKL